MGELLDNFLKVYQLANFIKHSRIQDQLERERLEEVRANREYNRQLQDFEIQTKMSEIGAQEVQPIGDIQPGFGSDWLQAGKRQQVTSPFGRTYQVPTFEQRQQRLLDTIRAKGAVERDLATERTRATEQIRAEYRQPNLNIHYEEDNAGNVTKIITDPKTGEETSRESLGKIGKGTADPNLNIHFVTDDNGNTTKIVTNPKTGEEVSRTSVGKIGKSDAGGTSSSNLTKIESEVRAAEAKADELERQAANTDDSVTKRQAIAARADANAKKKQLKFLRKRGGQKQAEVDASGHAPGETITFQGKQYIYRGMNPNTGKMMLEPIQ